MNISTYLLHFIVVYLFSENKLCTVKVLGFLVFGLCSWKTSLLCIVWELAGGVSVAVAVGVGDR